MKALAFLLIPLVVMMISGMPMKSYADPQLDILLNIATQARDNLGATISQINNIPSEINRLYTQGSNETDALAQAASQGDVSSAKQHFLAAMKFFKETNDAINSLNATATNDQQKTEIIQLRGEIIRLENMGNLLRSIAVQNNVDINFTNFDTMLQNATQDINSGNLDDATKQVQNANDFLITTHNSLTQIAQERISQRAKDFTEKQIAQLNVNQTNTSLNNTSYSNNTGLNTGRPNTTQNIAPINPANNVPPVNNSNITIGKNPKEMVTELKRLVAEGKVDQAINLIKIIQAYQKAQLSEKFAERSHINNTESTPTPPPAHPVNNTESTPPVNNTESTPTPPPAHPVNNTESTPTPPPAHPVNNTESTPQSHAHQHTGTHDSKHNNHENRNGNNSNSEKNLQRDD